jgi:hypothetical protein
MGFAAAFAVVRAVAGIKQAGATGKFNQAVAE